MLDLHSARRAADDRERAQKAGTAKVPTFAPGARSREEHVILTALRKEPATSVNGLRDSVKINNSLAFTLAYNALLHRGEIRETAEGYFGTMKIIASQTASD